MPRRESTRTVRNDMMQKEPEGKEAAEDVDGAHHLLPVPQLTNRSDEPQLSKKAETTQRPPSKEKIKPLTLNSVNPLMAFPPEFWIRVRGITSNASATALNGPTSYPTQECLSFCVQTYRDGHLRCTSAYRKPFKWMES